jgi:diguanylate cyclase (GGDEF)-like protein/PAS domain S-box-containing protein
VAIALTPSLPESLAASIAAGDTGDLERLFLAAKARPPLVVWRPDTAMLRSPVLARLLERWQALRPDPHHPPPAAAVESLLEGGIGDWTMHLAPPESGSALEAMGTPIPLDRFVYRHYGAGIARHYGRDMSGETMAAFPGHIGAFFAAVYEAVRMRPEPIFTEHEPPATVLVRSWRRLILPFADPGGSVCCFVVGNIPESAVGTLLDVMHDAALVTDGDGRIRLANRAASELLGPTAAALMGSRLDDHLPGLTGVMQGLAEQVDGVGALGRHELVLQRTDRPMTLDVSIGGTRVAGQPLFVLVLRDVTERTEREQALQTIAFKDELTGVLNRRGLRQEVPPAERRKARRSQDGFGLVIVDLDGFKVLNDSHGHAAGDAILQSVAGRLAQGLRGDDAVARWGGDEFVVLLHGVASPADLAAAAAKLQHVLEAPHLIGKVAHSVGVSIGAALYPAHGTDFDGVFAAADRALYAAKAAGGNRLQLAADPTG